MIPALSRVWKHVKLSDVSLGTRPRYSLVVDEDVKKPNKQIARPVRASAVTLLQSALSSVKTVRPLVILIHMKWS